MVKVRKTVPKNNKKSKAEEHQEEDIEDNTNMNESSLLKDCKALFNSTNLYQVLGIENGKTTSLAEIKKAYHKVSLKVHPDKVEESLKEESKAKFQALGKVYSILSDPEKRKLYDETGRIDGEEFFVTERDWDDYWKLMFKKITEEDIKDFFKNYQKSQEEKDDLLRLYKKHEGDMNKILTDMFSESILDDEERFREIIQTAINDKEVDAFDMFVNESKEKKNKRKQKYEKEAKEAEKMKNKLGLPDDLTKAIALNQENRMKKTEQLLKNMEEKYSKPAKRKKDADNYDVLVEKNNDKEKKPKKKKQKDEESDESIELKSEEDDDDDNDDDDEEENTTRKKLVRKPSKRATIQKPRVRAAAKRGAKKQ